MNQSLQSTGRVGRLGFAKKFIPLSRWGVLHLLITAAVLHVGLALLLLAVGRAATFPNIVDRDAIVVPLDRDSRDYRIEAVKLADTFKGEGFRAWAMARADAHTRLISLLFALFGPGVLIVEPLNLAAYLVILCFVFKLGKEICNQRAGLFAACVVAVWPSFLLHTTQLLKDPFYIAATLALTFVVSTWLTRTYHRRAALASAAAGGALIGALVLIRKGSGTVVFVVVTLGIILLTLRLLRDGWRQLGWNLFSALLVLVFVATFLNHGVAKFRNLSSAPSAAQVIGTPDSQRGSETQGGALPEALPEPANTQSGTLTSRLKARVDLNAARVGRLRRGFTHGYSDAGSTIDGGVEFNNIYDLIHYLPRAAAVGFFSPFPDMWFDGGRSVGTTGRLISGFETLVMYFIELLSLIGLWQSRRRLSVWLLFLIATFGVISLGLVVANIGALYRMRYVFWILLIILGTKGLDGCGAGITSFNKNGVRKRWATAISCGHALLGKASQRGEVLPGVMLFKNHSEIASDRN